MFINMAQHYSGYYYSNSSNWLLGKKMNATTSLVQTGKQKQFCLNM